MTFEVRHGDALELLRGLADASVDAVVTDPPYALKFMGKAWDTGLPSIEVWAECLRVVKPGAHLVAFGGTRTFHRLTCAIEDAGFEIRDCLMWLYGSGFPKSLDVSKAIDKHLGAERPRDVMPQPRSKLHGDRPWMNDQNHRFESKEPITAAAAALQGLGTALKPAWEPIVLARKPLIGTVAANVLKHGTGALAIDPCRINPGEAVSGGGNGEAHNGGRFGAGETSGTRPRVEPHDLGRWPANVVLDEDAAELLDEQTGERTSGFMAAGTQREGLGYHGALGNVVRNDTRGDSGGASRFFYMAKASSCERHYAGKNTHPTVKPVDLMRWLCRLVTPKGGLILDPYTGSGSTGVAALSEGFAFLGFDNDPESIAIARRRIAGPLFVKEQPA